jgi:hypothetical protein
MNSRKTPNPSIQLNVLKTPFCGDLRSKKFYMRDAIPTCAEDYIDSSGHTWCYNTQMPLGPDGMHATPHECGPDRACYRSALQTPDEYVADPKNSFVRRLA